MQVIESPTTVRDVLRKVRREGATVGVVPTMGALHVGHISLMEAAGQKCDFVVVTIFVNPMQFGPDEDFDRYPRNLEDDIEKCRAAGVDLVFAPSTTEIYAPGTQSIVQVTNLTQKLEGERRPGHFDGVTTIVAKLFNIVDPDRAYFGQKDYQQQLVIRRMVTDLDWGIEIVTCPIVRESDGLAMSSRNRYLSDDDRQRSLILSQALTLAEELAALSTGPAEIAARMQRLIAAQEGIELDYAVVADRHTLEPASDDAESGVALLAAKLGKTRLIDNRELRFR